MLKSLFSGWKFDLKSSVITVLVAPVAIYFLAVLRKYVKVWGAYALEGMLYWLSRFFRRSLAGSLTLKRYCRMRLAEENRYLFVPSSLDVKLEVDEAFVTLTLDNQGGKGINYDHRDILAAGNRIRVIGDPGSGKSSLIKRLFRDACYHALRKPSKARLPLLVELKNLSVPGKQHPEKLGDWFVKKLRDATSKSKVYQMEECFDTYAENTGLFVLLDGLDEVSTSNYAKVQSAIIALSHRLSQMSEHSIIVLTMRTQFHQQVKNAFRDSFGPALLLKPFTPTDIYEFLTRWPFHNNREHHIARIYGELTDRPTLREMCSNPLILAMYVAEDQAAGHVVAPESRTEFYAKVTEELLVKRRLQQIGPTPAHTKLREQRERILGRLAYEHMLDANQPANSLEWKSAIRVAQDVMKCSDRDAEAIFREIAKETGLVTEERSGQSFRFIHLTFCEFLAAFEAVQGQQDGWSNLVECHRKFQSNPSQPQLRTRLLEVIPFACGLLPRVGRSSAISDVTLVGDDALLARCFLETKQYDHAGWPSFTERQKSALLTAPEAKWDDRWLRDLHLFNVVVKDATQCAEHMPILDSNVDLDRFFQTLVGNQKESLSKLLSAYATQDAAAAFRLAEVSNLDLATDFPAIVIANCDQSPFLALVIEKALSQTSQIEQWASLLAESALRSRAVAESISRIEATPALNQRLAAIPRRKRWFRKGIVPETLYTQVLTIAVNSPNVDQASLTCIKLLKPVCAPGAMWISPRMLSLLLLTFMLALLPVSLLAREMPFFAGLPSLWMRPFYMGMVLYTSMPFAMALRNRWRGYRALIGLGGDRAMRLAWRFKTKDLANSRSNRLILHWLFYAGVSKELRKAMEGIEEFKNRGADLL